MQTPSLPFIQTLAVLGLMALALVLLPGCQRGGGPAGGPHQRVRVDAEAAGDTQAARRLNATALERVEAGELTEAEALLKQAVEADVMFGPARNNLGKVYFDQGKLYQAAWEFEYAVQLMPHHIEPKNNLALVLERARRLDEAVSYYREALEIEPDNVEVLGNLLRTRLERGDRNADVRRQLEDLILKDTRPEWVQWAQEQLALMGPVQE